MKHEFLSQRAEKIQPCSIGADGFCCKNCMMGPCRLIGPVEKGICGASKELVLARNLMRTAAAGAAAHVGHALHVLNYQKKSMPKDVVKHYASPKLQALWKKLGIYPGDPFEELSESLHQTVFGVDSDWKHVLIDCLKLGIIDGCYGLYLATELEDKQLGTPKPNKGWMDLGVISKDKTNIVVHGHEAILPSKIAKHRGDANLVGVCCTGAELLAYYGIPLAANTAFSEQVLATGAIEAMVVDVQCIMPSIADIAGCYHTKLITTHDIARMPGALHMPFNKENADAQAKKIVKLANDNKKHRQSVAIPSTKTEIWGGWTHESMPIAKLKNQLKTGELKGVVAFIGCPNPRIDIDAWAKLAEKLAKSNYLVLTTGCIGYELGKRGLLVERDKIYHLGSCINNARVAEIFKRLASGEIADENFLVSCPAPISEKVLAIGLFFLAIGTSLHVGFSPVAKNGKVAGYLNETLGKVFGSKVFVESDPEKFWKETKGKWKV